MTLDAALDELYGKPLDEFVATRNRLAKQLGGEEGKTLAKLRKPTRAAWVLNRLARDRRRDVDLLLDAGHRLRQAGLDRDAVQRARAAETDAIKRLTKAAEALGAGGQALTQVNESLRAAAIAEGGRELLARGRFTEPMHASGFEAYAALALPKRRGTTKRTDEQRRATAELRELEQKLRAAEQRAQAARAEADALAAAVDAAARRLRSL